MQTELAIVYGLACAPSGGEPETCFAASIAGLQRSDDNGATWHGAWESLNLSETLAATAVAISSGWATDLTVFAAAPGGVFRSIDGGRSWSMALLPRPTPFVSQLLLSPAYPDDGLIFAGTVEDGVYRSGDRGATWEAWNIGLFDPQILCMAASPDLANDRTLFVGTESGIFQSVNTGRFWRELRFAMDHAPVLSLAISSQFGQDGTLFAGTEAHGLWRSSDCGATWQHVQGLDNTDPINAVIVDANTDRVVVLLDQTIMESRDGGSSWKVRVASPNEASFTAIAAPYGAEGALLVGLSDGGVLRVTHP